MDDLSRMLQAIDLLYGSTLNEDALPKALEAIAELGGAEGVFYLTFDPRSGAARRSYSTGIDPAIQAEYLAYYGTIDVRVPPALALPVGSPVTEHAFVDRGAFESSEIYRDFLTRYDIPHILAYWTAKSASQLSAMSLQRTRRQGRFLRPDTDKLAPVIPHLVRALRIRDALQSARESVQNCMQVIDRLPFGVVFLDESGCVAELSAFARRLVNAADALSIKAGRLHAVRSRDDVQLQRAIFHATAVLHDRLPGDTLSLRRRDGRHSLSVAVIPFRSPPLLLPRPPACMLLLFDPASSPRPAVLVVKETLQVSHAEALLACQLFTGVTLREAAEQLQISVNTCKSQLKSIYAKTGCRSHVDLAKVLLMSGILGNPSA